MKCIIIHNITDKTMEILNREGINFSVESHQTEALSHSNVHNPKSCAELVKGMGFKGITSYEGKLINNHTRYHRDTHNHDIKLNQSDGGKI